MADDEVSLSKKIKQIDREIYLNQLEIDKYKRDTESLKNKMEFKLNLERTMNIESLVRLEKIKNKELLKEYESLVKQNHGQKKVIDIYDKSTGFPDKIELLNTEIKLIKDHLKDFYEKNKKQEKYLKSVHEKIARTEEQIKQLNIPKFENKRNFSNDELQDTITTINSLKNVINESKLKLKNSVKVNEEKLTSFINLNKSIESDFKENERV
jgi:hypothetical protein